ncbi:hypothetical protein GBA52_025339 [Prunus armeniaca]|nr:hypothetical protein GBA52_025339 [Prunus armeniaca]
MRLPEDGQSAPDGPYAWGYCFINENNQDVYCTPSAQYPCILLKKKYYYRGPIQLTQRSLSLISSPNENKPSSHDVIMAGGAHLLQTPPAGRVPGME